MPAALSGILANSISHLPAKKMHSHHGWLKKAPCTMAVGDSQGLKVLIDSSVGVNRRYGGVRRVGQLLKVALEQTGAEVQEYRDVLRKCFGITDSKLGRGLYLIMLRVHQAGYLRKHNFSHVHFVNYLAHAPRNRDWQVLVHFHDLRQYHGVDVQRTLLTMWRNRMIRQSLGCADRLVTISEWERHNILFWLKPEQPVEVLRNCIGAEWENKVTQSQPCNKRDVGTRCHLGSSIILPGPLVRRKGHLAFLQLFKDEILINRLAVIITGDGEMGEAIKAFNQNELQGKVQFLGFLADEKLRAIYQQCKAGVLFSEYEGFGLPVIEMLSQGLPVFVRSNSVFPEILQARPHSLLPDSPVAFRQALLTELSRDDFEQRHAVRRSDWERFNFANFRRRIVEIYTQVPTR